MFDLLIIMSVSALFGALVALWCCSRHIMDANRHVREAGDVAQKAMELLRQYRMQNQELARMIEGNGHGG